MNYYPYDSRNPLYKNHIGAVCEDETVRFRLLLHRDALCYDAFLVIQKDSELVMEYKMTPAEYLEDYRFYDYELNLSEGLYWYSFRYTSGHGEFFVTKTDGSLGTVSADGSKWQQTVYQKDFSTPRWLKGGIIYQIFPDRFYFSGKKKENVPNDRLICRNEKKPPQHIQQNSPDTLGNDYYCGDLAGIKEKLPYLQELGVTCIYLNPIFEAHSNHRYNTADYMKIDPLLGDEEDFKALCDEALQRGIRMILDGVFSHTGDDSIYFNKYGRYGGTGAYSDPASPFRAWYTFRGEYPGYNAWWGVPSLPEVNENDPQFTQFITGETGVLRHWLKLGAFGWRLDVADELPDAFLDNIRQAIKEENPEAFLLGEVWEDATNKISYGARRRFLRGKQLDSVMNYPFKDAIINFVCEGNAETLNETVLTLAENYPKCTLNLLMNHLGTHDTARVISAIAKHGANWGDRNNQAKITLTQEEYNNARIKLKAAAVIQFTLPGVPSVYYGDEVGMQGFCDPFCRGFHPWEDGDKEILEFYKELAKIRKHPAFMEGEYIPCCAKNGNLAYLRQDKTTVLVAVCMSDYFEMPLKYEFKNCFGKQPKDQKIRLNKNEFCILY